MKRSEITDFLENREELKRLLKMTKESAYTYLEKEILAVSLMILLKSMISYLRKIILIQKK